MSARIATTSIQSGRSARGMSAPYPLFRGRITPYTSSVAYNTLISPSAVSLVLDDVDFWSMQVDLQPNYYDGFVQRVHNVRRVAVAEYLNGNNIDAYVDAMCVEMPVPKQVASKMKLVVPAASVSNKEAVCLFHSGRASSVAPLHYDWDHRWVLHACLTGRKTIYLIPPEAGWLLTPIVNTSAICLPRLSAADRMELLRRLGGSEVALVAGKAVLFPSLWWHAVRYEAPSMSVSVRFGEDPTLRPFAVLPRSFWLQRLLWQLFQSRGGVARVRYLNRCLEEFFQPRMTWLQRYRAMNQVYRSILIEVSQANGAEYLTSDGFNSELYIARDELATLYSINSTRSLERATESVESVQKYLFAGLDLEKPGAVPYKTQRALAQYALAKRQGLRPRRGLVAVHRKRQIVPTNHPIVPPGREQVKHENGAKIVGAKKADAKGPR